MAKETQYRVTHRWVGNDGRGTADLDSFGRDGELSAEGRPTIPTGPLPGAHRGTGDGWTPEDLLAGAVSQCHMLWFLHLCAKNGLVVSDYVDEAVATLRVKGSQGHVTRIDLHVTATIAGDPDLAHRLFTKAGDLCYVARSLSAEVGHHLTVVAPA